MQLSIKNLSIDTLIYGFGNVFTRLITFLLLPLYTNILTPSEYGIITIIYVFMGFMNIIYHYGLDSFQMDFGDGLLIQYGNNRRLYLSILFGF